MGRKITLTPKMYTFQSRRKQIASLQKHKKAIRADCNQLYCRFPSTSDSVSPCGSLKRVEPEEEWALTFMITF